MDNKKSGKSTILPATWFTYYCYMSHSLSTPEMWLIGGRTLICLNNDKRGLLSIYPNQSICTLKLPMKTDQWRSYLMFHEKPRKINFLIISTIPPLLYTTLYLSRPSWHFFNVFFLLCIGSENQVRSCFDQDPIRNSFVWRCRVVAVAVKKWSVNRVKRSVG